MICHIKAHFSYLRCCSQPFFQYRLSVMVGYYLMCCMVGMKYLLAAELRQLLRDLSAFNLISAKEAFSPGYYIFPKVFQVTLD